MFYSLTFYIEASSVLWANRCLRYKVCVKVNVTAYGCPSIPNHDLKRLSFLHKNGFESLSRELTLFVQLYRSRLGTAGWWCCSGHLCSYTCVTSHIINHWQKHAQAHNSSCSFFYSFFYIHILPHIVMRQNSVKSIYTHYYFFKLSLYLYIIFLFIPNNVTCSGIYFSEIKAATPAFFWR